MPHPYCVTFLYRSSRRSWNPTGSSNNNNNNDTHTECDVPVTGHQIISTAEEDERDAQLLLLLIRNSTNRSIEMSGMSNYMHDKRYSHYLDRLNDYHTFTMGMIIDENNGNKGFRNDDSTCMLHLTNLIDTIRLTLPLDSKRPTVNRRFYHDQEHMDTGHTHIVHDIERIVYQTLINASSSHKTNYDAASIDTMDNISTLGKEDNVEWFVYCNRYLRILEYDVVGEKKLGLAPHTDGIKICEKRQIKSTHTLLFYLTDCSSGGETVIMDPSNHHWSKHSQVVVPPDRIYYSPNYDSNHRTTATAFINVAQNGCPTTNVALGISPKRGRIFLFPHPWPHAGAIVDGTIPKIMLRAEITIQYRLI